MRREFLSVAEAAKMLGLRPETLSNWRYKRKGPPFRKYGNQIWYDPEEVSAWLDQHRVEPKPGIEAEVNLADALDL
jgi:hypothetical protein